MALGRGRQTPSNSSLWNANAPEKRRGVHIAVFRIPSVLCCPRRLRGNHVPSEATEATAVLQSPSHRGLFRHCRSCGYRPEGVTLPGRAAIRAGQLALARCHPNGPGATARLVLLRF